jgi:hypothetical protein
MKNFAHPGHPHVEGATHVSGGNSIVAILSLSIAIVIISILVIYIVKGKK